MGHQLYLELQSSSSGYQLKVVATFEGEGFVNGGYLKHDWNAETQEWTVDVIATSAAPGVSRTIYMIPFDGGNPIPNANQSILVRLTDADGRELQSARVGGGGTILSGGDTNDGTRPFEDPEFIRK